jgi:hypothetical protein
MIQIEIAAMPNQRLTTRVGTSFFEIELKATAGVMAATVLRDGVIVVRSSRVVAGEAIIPYRYLEDGNFAVTTLNEDLPDWTKFGVSQFLVYATADELASLRNG